MPAPVPFVALDRQHRALADEFREAQERVLASSGFILGAEVERFEQEFATFCGTEECVGVASGTAALTLALLAAGICEGDEVIVPAHTYIASAFGVAHAGAVPVFCEVSTETGLIDVSTAESLISGRTAAIMPVHLYGQACDMDAVGAFASKHGLAVVEDCAQAHGATWRGQRVGSFGKAAGFSFYPTKNLGALGDGGAICTSDPEVAARVRALRNIGQRTKGEHVMLGYNERLDGLQAAFLSIKLRHLEAGNEKRRELAQLYRENLPAEVTLLEETPDSPCVFHLYPIRVDSREELAASLREMGIGTGVHYSPIVPDQPPFADARAVDQLEASRAWAEQELSLPMDPALEPDEIVRAAQCVSTALSGVPA